MNWKTKRPLRRITPNGFNWIISISYILNKNGAMSKWPCICGRIKLVMSSVYRRRDIGAFVSEWVASVQVLWRAGEWPAGVRASRRLGLSARRRWSISHSAQHLWRLRFPQSHPTNTRYPNHDPVGSRAVNVPSDLISSKPSSGGSGSPTPIQSRPTSRKHKLRFLL